MAKENHFFHYIVIVIFAAGVVALGAEEVQRNYIASPDGGNSAQLVQELKGRYRQDMLSDGINSGEARAGLKREVNRKTKEVQSDDLNRSDRAELSNLIDSVMDQ